MSVRTHLTRFDRTHPIVGPEVLLVSLFTFGLLAIYGTFAYGLVGVGLGPSFAAWLVAVGLLGAGPFLAVQVVSYLLDRFE